MNPLVCHARRCIRTRFRRSMAPLAVGILLTAIVLVVIDASFLQDHASRTKGLLKRTPKSVDWNFTKDNGNTRDIQMQSDGERLANRVSHKCLAGRINYRFTLASKNKKFPITTNNQQRLLFCPMCKLASTYWTRFFTFIRQDPSSNHTSPYDVPLSLAPPTKERLTLIGELIDRKYERFYKFLFVRDPFGRILSAYVDKFFAPNPTFWRTAKLIVHKGRSSLMRRHVCGSDMTFREYVQAIIRSHNKKEGGCVDCHDLSFVSACHPCQTQYSFIGKMETFFVDSVFIYRKLGLNSTVEYLQSDGKRLADEDALIDTVSSPYKWRKDIEKCISWREALTRVWRKLQIRGVVGKDLFPLSEEEARTITQVDFIKLIKEVQSRTSYTDRKLQRKEALQEIYSTLSDAEVNDLIRVYKRDFDLFEYDPNPHWLQDRQNVGHKFGYLSV